MGKIGNIALSAANLVKNGIFKDPVEAWENAMSNSDLAESSRKKGCAKGTFLGLCEEGLIIGIRKAKYTSSNRNKEYGIVAARLIKQNPKLVDNKSYLWRTVLSDLCEPVDKNQNSQMDVIITLWKNKLIK